MSPDNEDARPGRHATFRGHPGTELAVLTFEHFAPAPTGQVYRAWIRLDGRWQPPATVRPSRTAAR